MTPYFSTPYNSNTTGKKRHRSRDTRSNMEQELITYMRESMKSREAVDLQLQYRPQKTVEDAFFESCAIRMKALPASVKSVLQLQTSQLFFNAENQDTQVPIMTLPPSQLLAPTQNVTELPIMQLPQTQQKQETGQ